jgi:excisionase family DNA binding protein
MQLNESDDVRRAISSAEVLVLQRQLKELAADELLLGCCLHVLSQFGIARIGDIVLDLEELGVDWARTNQAPTRTVCRSKEVIAICERAALIARASHSTTIRIEDLLAAFAGRRTGVMRELKERHGITSVTWRAAIARLASDRGTWRMKTAQSPALYSEYLTPEQAADVLGVHVQTVRGYVRSGKLPASRLAGERAIRIRRSDLECVLESVTPQHS